MELNGGIECAKNKRPVDGYSASTNEILRRQTAVSPEQMLELARTPWGESPLKIKKPRQNEDLNGGIEGARTLDLLRDRQTL